MYKKVNLCESIDCHFQAFSLISLGVVLYYYINTHHSDKIKDIIDLLCTDLALDADNQKTCPLFGTMQNIVVNIVLLAEYYTFNYML